MGERNPTGSRRRRSRRSGRLVRRTVAATLAVPAAYLLAAVTGSLVPVNGSWTEPDEGITIYLADNGIHSDIVMPVRAGGLDWTEVIQPYETRGAPRDAPWVAFGSGEEKVYLETPTWWDIRPATIWAALTGGKRVLHAEWVPSPDYAVREIRLRPKEYRRLWAAIRADFQGRPQRIDHPGYGCCDAFYRSGGRFSALSTCNTWAADKLRIAGVETSLWPPFTPGLLWRYRRTAQST